MSEGTLSLNFSCFNFFSVYCFRILTEILSKNWWRFYGRVAKTKLLVPRAKFSWETFFRVFSNSLWFSRITCDFRKRFASAWLKFDSSCPEDCFQGKIIRLIYFFLHPFRTSSGENFVFWRKFFDKIVIVHFTCAEENSEENKFSEENYIFSSFLDFEKKLF